jgi:hypothetical protein
MREQPDESVVNARRRRKTTRHSSMCKTRR